MRLYSGGIHSMITLSYEECCMIISYSNGHRMEDSIG